jgi:flavin-dependent dehydrogenase
MISLKKNYDAIVVGGGPAGSSTAALLAEKGHDVLVVEKEKMSSPRACNRESQLRKKKAIVNAMSY